jgi:hypothetical protein
MQPKANFAFQILNNLCAIEQKISIHGDPGNVKRNVDRIREALEGENLFYEDPMGQIFSETRTDLEASITGAGAGNLHVVEVIKPIIRMGDKQFSRVVQKGIVIVESKTTGEA